MSMKSKQRNPVAKHSRKLNKMQVHKDRKKALKRGECRHKKHWVDIKVA